MSERRIRLGIDVGGTFTDLVVCDEGAGTLSLHKVPTTPQDVARGILAGLAKTGVPAAELAEIAHGTTAATNAVLERKGARTGLVASQGFRDLLELRDGRRRSLWGRQAAAEPLVPRQWRYEVAERLGAAGEVLEALPEAELARLAERLEAERLEALAIAYLHADRNPAHERESAALLRARWPGRPIVLGSEVCPFGDERLRTATAALAAYLSPLMQRYVAGLSRVLQESGVSATFRFIESAGGSCRPEDARDHPLRSIFSGPAGGAMAGASLAELLQLPAVATADMGGTSFDVAVIEDGRPNLTGGRSLEFGLTVAVPSIDIHSAGIGGGSLVGIDEALPDGLQVGPESAGAYPGPACFGRGGRKPTITDATLLLGRLADRQDLGLPPLDREAAAQAMLAEVCPTLKLTPVEAARVVLEVAEARMAAFLGAQLGSRGVFPGEASLLAFGGAGPLHAAGVARRAGLRRVVVPYFAAGLSALGCLLSPPARSAMLAGEETLAELDAERLGRRLDAVFPARRQGRLRLELTLQRGAGGREDHLAVRDVGETAEARIRRYHAFTERAYGIRPDPRTVRVVRLLAVWEEAASSLDMASLLESTFARRRAQAPGAEGAVEGAEIPQRAVESLGIGVASDGPALVVLPGASAYVPRKSRYLVDRWGNLILEAQ